MLNPTLADMMADLEHIYNGTGDKMTQAGTVSQ